MQNLTQQIERARAYLADIRAGHVSFADEGAPFMTLSGHLAALLDIIDDQYLAFPLPEGEQARVRDELLAEVPASQRLPDPQPGDFAWAVSTALVRQPGDVAQAVTEWLRAARSGRLAVAATPEEAVKTAVARLAEPQEDILCQAFADAIAYRMTRFAGGCADCADCADCATQCAEHQGHRDTALLYRHLASAFGIDPDAATGSDL